MSDLEGAGNAPPPGERRCPSCGATNPVDAAWCNQCLQRHVVAAPEEAGPPHDIVDMPSPQPEVPATDDGPPAAAAPDPQPAGSAFHTTEGGLAWTCARCGTEVPATTLRCTVCSAALAEQLAPQAPPPREVAPTTALAATVVAPGSAHIAVGRHGTGIARLLLVATWLLGGVLLLRGGVLVGGPMLLGAALVWFGSLLDALRLSDEDHTELLRPRVMLWLVVVVLVATLAGMLASAATMSAT